MCFVTATELKKNLSYYLKLSESEDVHAGTVLGGRYPADNAVPDGDQRHGVYARFESGQEEGIGTAPQSVHVVVGQSHRSAAVDADAFGHQGIPHVPEG